MTPSIQPINTTGRRVQGYMCDFCDNKAVFTQKVLGGSDTMFLCKSHKNNETTIVRSGLVNTSDGFMPLHLVRNSGNIKQAIVETKSDIRHAITRKDTHQEKLSKYKLQLLESIL